MPCLVARSRTKVRALSIAKGRSNVANSSSIRPASTLERSRISLISESKWRPDERMSSVYSACFSFSSPNILSPQDFREADDRVQWRAQLMGHVCEKFGLVPVGGLDLPVLLLDFPEQPRVLNRQS